MNTEIRKFYESDYMGGNTCDWYAEYCRVNKELSALKSTAQFSAPQEGEVISIDSLLLEFKRQGFDTTNWDGDEGAEKAIVDGVKKSMLTDKYY